MDALEAAEESSPSPKQRGLSGIKAALERIVGEQLTPLDVHFAAFFTALMDEGYHDAAMELQEWYLELRDDIQED